MIGDHKGLTTNIANNTIDLLFSYPDNEIILKDHHLRKDHLTRQDEYNENNKKLLEIVKSRLKTEHDRELVVREEGDNIIIKLKNIE